MTSSVPSTLIKLHLLLVYDKSIYTVTNLNPTPNTSEMQVVNGNLVGMHLASHAANVVTLHTQAAFAITSYLHRPFLTAQGEHEFNRNGIKRKVFCADCDLKLSLYTEVYSCWFYYDEAHAMLILCILCSYHTLHHFPRNIIHEIS